MDYQLFYLVDRSREPFQQALVFHATERLPHGPALDASSTISPTGRTLCTVQLGTTLSHDRRTPDGLSPPNLGTSTISGMVMDQDGKPVEGAALRIGKERVYPDSKGIFFYREERSARHPFCVLLDDFTEDRIFLLHSAPLQVQSTAHSVEPVRVLGERLPLTASSTRDKTRAEQGPVEVTTRKSTP